MGHGQQPLLQALCGEGDGGSALEHSCRSMAFDLTTNRDLKVDIRARPSEESRDLESSA